MNSMDKIGIVTLFRDNYGSELQCYATKHYLEGLGYKCDVLYEELKGADKIFNKLFGWSDTLIKSVLYPDYWKNRTEMRSAKKIADNSLSIESQNDLDYFAETILQPKGVEHRLLKKQLFRESYKYFICGSDQVWNGANRITGFRFLDFADDDQKIALSPSFGMDHIKKYNIRRFKKSISKFKYLSARESTGVRIIADLVGQEVPQLTDPVVLLKPEEWEEFSSCGLYINEPYIFVHFLDSLSQTALYRIQYIADMTKCKIICFAYPQKEYENFTNWQFVDGDPRDYVNLIRRASYVCTDSFHSTYFSIIFEKAFFTFKRNYQHSNSQNSRIETLLNLYGANSHYIMEDSVINIEAEGKCKFQKKVDKERERLSKYLKVSICYNSCNEDIPLVTPRLKTADECVGCMGCAQVCRHSAISTVCSDFGYRLPFVEKEKCIQCRQCEKVCSMPLLCSSEQFTKSYIAFNKDIEMKNISASGGTFSGIAKAFIEQGGVVIGAKLFFNEGIAYCKHILIDNVDDLPSILGSKYVESDLSDVYGCIRKTLSDGIKLLFCGTSCQVAAVYKYLKVKKMSLENLFTIDLICHGVPGIELFRSYIRYIEKKYSAKVESFAFRKKMEGNIEYIEQIELRSRAGIKEEISIPMAESAYYKMFMGFESYRDVCYHCEYANIDKVADITVGDYFEARDDYPDFFRDDNNCLNNYINTLIVHNTKGQQLIESFGKELNLIEVSTRKVQMAHRQLCSPSSYSHIRINAMEAYKHGGYSYVDHLIRREKKKRYFIDKIKRIKQYCFHHS